MSTVSFTANGESRQADAGTCIAHFLERAGLPPQTVLVERNGRTLLRSEFDQQIIEPGDRLEIFRVAAGG